MSTLRIWNLLEETRPDMTGTYYHAGIIQTHLARIAKRLHEAGLRTTENFIVALDGLADQGNLANLDSAMRRYHPHATETLEDPAAISYWLIGQGKVVFRNAMKDTTTLRTMRVDDDDLQVAEDFGILYQLAARPEIIPIFLRTNDTPPEEQLRADMIMVHYIEWFQSKLGQK